MPDTHGYLSSKTSEEHDRKRPGEIGRNLACSKYLTHLRNGLRLEFPLFCNADVVSEQRKARGLLGSVPNHNLVSGNKRHPKFGHCVLSGVGDMLKGLVTRSNEQTDCSASNLQNATTPVRAKRKRTTGIAVMVAAGLMLSGCATPIIGALTIAEISTIAGLVSTFMSGRDLTEHALSAETGQDCRILESILSSGRSICENHGSSATAGDFQGVVALLDGSSNSALAQADIEIRRATNPVALGFVPIDRRISVEGFSLEAVAADSASEHPGAHRVSFGMLQASYGQSWSYELTNRREPTREARTSTTSSQQVASAEPTALTATRSDGAVIVPQPITN